ncbi:MAG: hypothetical protein BMS9Abin01_2735 [Gammaproteobacteria bacterium]|nr:MAG: hypothetical protein BMS9Abin01_2735 [Gammaproteobacteria bacterium]
MLFYSDSFEEFRHVHSNIRDAADLVPASLSGSATSLMSGTRALLAGTMLVANFLAYPLPHQKHQRGE